MPIIVNINSDLVLTHVRQAMGVGMAGMPAPGQPGYAGYMAGLMASAGAVSVNFLILSLSRS
jgi:hypothetical protein